MDITKIPINSKFPSEFSAIVEIGSGITPVKYEFDKDSGALFVDRFLSTAMFYPWNYGFIPHTNGKDGDPLDVLIVTDFSLISGCVISCRPIGALQMWDEKGEDFKIIAVPSSDVSQVFDEVLSYSDLPRTVIRKVEHFFAHYKDLEPGKITKVGKWMSRADTEEFIKNSRS